MPLSVRVNMWPWLQHDSSHVSEGERLNAPPPHPIPSHFIKDSMRERNRGHKRQRILEEASLAEKTTTLFVLTQRARKQRWWANTEGRCVSCSLVCVFVSHFKCSCVRRAQLLMHISGLFWSNNCTLFHYKLNQMQVLHFIVFHCQ